VAWDKTASSASNANLTAVAAPGPKSLGVTPGNAGNPWNGELRLQRTWTYTGTSPVTVNIHCSTGATGKCRGGTYFMKPYYVVMNAEIVYEFGVWDVTGAAEGDNGTAVGAWTKTDKSDCANKEQAINENPSPVITFAMQPGHKYSFVLHTCSCCKSAGETEQPAAGDGGENSGGKDWEGTVNVTWNSAVTTY
jgi:hypothetical protein